MYTGDPAELTDANLRASKAYQAGRMNRFKPLPLSYDNPESQEGSKDFSEGRSPGDERWLGICQGPSDCLIISTEYTKEKAFSGARIDQLQLMHDFSETRLLTKDQMTALSSTCGTKPGDLQIKEFPYARYQAQSQPGHSQVGSQEPRLYAYTHQVIKPLLDDMKASVEDE